MDAIQRIEAALAAGPRDGVWEFGSFAAGVLVVDSTHGKHWPIATTADEYSVPWDKTESSKDAFNNAAFIAACNPTAIREVLQTLASKEAELAEAALKYVSLFGELQNAMEEVARLKTAIVELLDDMDDNEGLAGADVYDRARALTTTPQPTE